MSDPVRIVILGDYDPKSPTLPAVEKSLGHASAQLNMPVAAEWIATPSVLAPDAEKKLESFDGLWAAPGSPYKSFDGMLKGIEFARRRDWPFDRRREPKSRRFIASPRGLRDQRAGGQ